MKIDRWIGRVVLLAALFLLTIFLLRDFLNAYFVEPAAQFLWDSNRLFASIDQAVYWTGLILVLLVIGLVRFFQLPASSAVDQTKNGDDILNSIRHWRTLILLTSNETDRLNFLKNALRSLLKDLNTSIQQSQLPWENDADFTEEDARIPASIRKFLVLDPPANALPNLPQSSRKAPGRLFHRLRKQDQTEYYHSIAEVISYIEQQLENENES